ncbi:hypothetical protein DUNSADRAFT_11000 [Dunaliella salina]|uniref:Uncharacterized protein n=1 Tax=Dunaliella salina TaxID=3046 RepID=A0ABQ7GEC6_DUNSA|nr:hypothetical protein DUNSADRAFT_11000 [Dunaliella salina]|eukprot:KAF5832954.1 hypothetical protein DUNSADRAFT_11000 [Dunaliella salina]
MSKKQPPDGYKLPPLELGTVIEALQPRSGQLVRHTLPIRVVDDADHDVVYGEFYVRQTPQPVAMALLPIGPAFQAAIAAAAVEARGVEVTLRHVGSGMPEVIAASIQDGSGGAGSKRGRGGTSGHEDGSRAGSSSGGRGSGAARTMKQGWLSLPPALAAAAAAAAGSTSMGGAAGGAPGSGGPSDAPTLPAVNGWAVTDKPPASQRTKINWWHDRVVLDSPLEVRAKVPFQLHFMLLDQLDIPVRASEHAQHHITATATTSLTPTGAMVTKRTMSAEIVGGWQWNLEDKGGPPVHSVMVQVSGVGAGHLHLQSEDVRVVEGATCSSTLLLSLPVLVSSGPVAAHGMQLSSPTPLCTISALTAAHAGDAQPGGEAGNMRGSKRRRGNGTEGELAEVADAPAAEEAMDMDRPGNASTSAATVAAAAGAAGAAEDGTLADVFSIKGLLSCCASPTAVHQLQRQAAKSACGQQLQALLPGLPPDAAHVRGMVMHAYDGGSVVVAISLHDQNGCLVSQDGKLDIVPLEGWMPGLEIQSVATGAPRGGSSSSSSSGGGRLLHCKRGCTTFTLKVPPSLAVRTRDSLPQRLLIKPCAPYESALPLVLEVVLSPGDYPTHLALLSAPELDSQWTGEPLIFKLSNLSSPNSSSQSGPYMPRLQVEVRNGSGEAVHLSKLGPVKATLRCCWLQRQTSSESAQQQHQEGLEPYQPHVDAQGHVVWVEELPTIHTQDSPQGITQGGSQRMVVWREVERNSGWCSQPGRPRWEPGSCMAVWEQDTLPVPRQADAFRLAVCAADLPIIITHFVEVESALPHHVALVDTEGQQHQQQGQHLRSLPSLPVDVEGRDLQVVTRAHLTPHTLRSPRVTVTAKDVHGNAVNLPVGTVFDLLVVQKEQQEQQQQQQQLEWVVDRIIVPTIKVGKT